MIEDLIEPAMNMLTGSMAFIVLLPYLDRLRLMAWKTHLWRVVGMHLAWALWLGWVAFHGLVLGDVDPYQLFGLLAAALWLAVSFGDWPHNHPPEETESGPVPLGMVGEHSRRFDA
jgi:hypothetical protein